MKVNAQLEELRFAQFVDRWVDAAKEVKAVAVDVIGVVDEEGVPNFQQVAESLMEDYTWMVCVVESRLVAYKEYMQIVLSREQCKELKVGVEKLSVMLSIQLKEACTTLEKALPQEADRLKEEHDVFFNQKLPELNRLRRSFNLKPTHESGYAVLSPHPKTEADGMKFSACVVPNTFLCRKMNSENAAIKPGKSQRDKHFVPIYF